MPGSKPGERRGGRKKGSANKIVGGKPKKTREQVMGELLPPTAPGATRPGEWNGIPGDPYDPYYMQKVDILDLLVAIAEDVRLQVGVRAKFGLEALPYMRSRMAVAPYRPPDHDGRVIIEVVEFSEKDFDE